MTARLLLASTSPYRRELLSRLRIPFDIARPEVDEAPHPGESPLALAQRLAAAKAATIAAREGDAWVIGSDQVAELDGEPLGKPGGRDQALTQLAAMSGRSVAFRTALCVMHRDLGRFDAVDTTVVRFRSLAGEDNAREFDAPQPIDSGGRFK